MCDYTEVCKAAKDSCSHVKNEWYPKCFEPWPKPQKAEAVLSNSTDGLASLDRCEEELHEMLMVSEKDKDNTLLTGSLEDAITYVSIAKGYLPA